MSNLKGTISFNELKSLKEVPDLHSQNDCLFPEDLSQLNRHLEGYTHQDWNSVPYIGLIVEVLEEVGDADVVLEHQFLEEERGLQVEGRA
jgi:hypothetical protein